MAQSVSIGSPTISRAFPAVSLGPAGPDVDCLLSNCVVKPTIAKVGVAVSLCGPMSGVYI